MKNKKIAIITSSLPNPFYSGGSLTAYSILLSFFESGFDVCLLTWKNEKVEFIENIESELEKAKVKIHYFSRIKKNFIKSLTSCFNNRLSSLLPYYNYQAELKLMLSSICPDLLLMYHWESLSVAYGIKDIPKIGLVGDPLNLPYEFRLEFERQLKRRPGPFKMAINILLRNRIKVQKEIMIKLLKDCSLCGAFAYHHAQMFKELGVRYCNYFRTPLPDYLMDGVKKRPLSEKPKILLLGHLKGIATLSGIRLFIDEIMPFLEKNMKEEEFRVHIVGGFFENLPKEMKKALDKPYIIIRGHVNPIDSEFLSSDLLLVPTPIELGIRVRIITAFSFGTPVVAHIANSKGIPELKHEENSLLSDSGIGLAKETVRLIKDRLLQKLLSENGRKTYEKYFSLNSAGRNIVTQAQQLIGGECAR